MPRILRPRQVLAIVLVFALGLATLVQPRRALADAPTLSVTVTPLAERVKAGDTLDFQLSWSCSGTSSSCSDALIEVPLPTLAPDNTQRVEFIRATDSTGGLLNFSNNGDRVLRWRGAAVPAGSSGQIQITLRTQNLITPDGSTVTPVATFTAAGATAATASATTTITAINDMITDKRVVGFSRYDVADIGLGRQVSYQISTMHANQQGWSGLVEHTSDNGYVGLQNVRTTDVLPEGAEFVRATLGGTYDPATRTVSWPAWSEPGTTPNYELVVRYPSPDFALGQMVTNTASATANPYQRPDEVLHSQASTTSHLVEPVAKGTISKGYAYPRSGSAARGSSTQWVVNAQNTGTAGLHGKLVDYLPCQFTSPTDGSTDCAKPAIKNVSIGLDRDILHVGETYPVVFTTNLGRTGTIQVPIWGSVRPPMSDGEWITRWTAEFDLPPGRTLPFTVGGTVVDDLPNSVEGVQYAANPKPPTTPGSVPRIENCLDPASQMTDPRTDAIVAQAGTATCGHTRVTTNAPAYGVNKVVNYDTVPGQFDVSLQPRTAGSANWYPIITDLLPAGMSYVPDSVRYNLVGNNTVTAPQAQMKTEVIDDFNHTGRQLVRITFGDGYLVANQSWIGSVSFIMRMDSSVKQGKYTNDVLSFDARMRNLGTEALPSQCYDSTRTPDVNNQSGLDDLESAGCLNSVNYDVRALPAVGGKNAVKGSLDTDYQGYPAKGRVEAGGDANYRITLENTGNVTLHDVVAYDVLPHVGDTGVGPASGDSRGSQFEPLLAGPPTGLPSGAQVFYSQSGNPCRPEVNPNVAGTCTDDWSPTFSGTARSFKIVLGDYQMVPGQSIPVTIPMTVDDQAEGVAWNSFAVNGKSDIGLQPVAVEPNKVGLVAVPTLQVSKSAGASVVEQGDELVWTLKVKNTSGTRSSATIVEDQLGEGLTFVSGRGLNTGGHDSTRDSYDPASGRWTLATPLEAGQEATFELTTKVVLDVASTGADGQVCNTARASDLKADDYATEPIDPVCVKVRYVAPQLSLTKTVSPAVATAGQPVTWTLTVTNPGTSVVDHDVVIKDVLPTGLWFQRAETANGAYDPATGLWTLADDLPAGKSATLRLVTTPTKDAPFASGSVQNVATATADRAEPVRAEASLNLAPGTVSGTVFLDANRDLGRDGTEAGLEGFTVELVDDQGAVVTDLEGDPVRAVTDAAGHYRFDQLPAGNFTVRVLDREGYVVLVPKGQPVTVVGGTDAVVNVPVFQVGSLQGLAWLDANGNHQPDAGESPIGGVRVSLVDANGQTVTDLDGRPVTAITGPDGRYTFSHLVPGDYTVRFTAPDGSSYLLAAADANVTVGIVAGQTVIQNVPLTRGAPPSTQSPTPAPSGSTTPTPSGSTTPTPSGSSTPTPPSPSTPSPSTRPPGLPNTGN